MSSPPSSSSIASIYATFLADPTPAVLAGDVALNYITTATQITHADEVAGHLTGLQNDHLLQKEEQTILNVVEGYCSLSLEVKTTLKFIAGGGPYLPDVEEESVKGKAATFIVIHIVHFDGSNKIAQIRLLWDQAALLKQLAIIPPDNNWPIKEPIEQTQLVADSATAAAKVAPEKPVKRTVLVKKSSSVAGSPSANRTATSARPSQRTASEIFGRHPDSSGPSTPKKPSFRTDPKKYSHFEFGEGQLPQVLPRRNFKERPHFEFGEAPVPKAKATAAAAASTPKKAAQHFEFGEAPLDAIPKHRLTKSRNIENHARKWDFEDFNTPEKPKPKVQPAHVRHFGISEEDVDATTSTTHQQNRRDRGVKPRKDAETHFEIRSDGTPGPLDFPRRTVGSFGTKASRLYDTNVVGDGNDGDEATSTVKSRANTTGPAKHGRKDIDTHWDLDDDDTNNSNNNNNNNNSSAKNGGPSHARHNKEMGHHWDVNNPADGAPDTETTQSHRAPPSHARHNKELDHHWDATDAPDESRPQQPTTDKPIPSDRAKAVKNITSSFNILTDDPRDAPGDDIAHSRKASVSSSTHARTAKDFHSTWDLPGGETPVKPAAAAAAAAAKPRAQQENRYTKAVQNMHSNWDEFYAQSTPARKQAEQVARKEENPVPSRQANPR
ncbi:DNA-directed RNA polymerase II subunit, partial [Ascosphaera pollenicola]